MINLADKVLVVVDMQPGYRLAMTPEVVESVEMLVKEARRCDSLIVFLEFADAPTFARLLDSVRRYDQFVVEQKQGSDGSREVLEACRRGNYDTGGFVVCGVETHVCVADTALSLARKRPGSTVEVVREGCGAIGGNQWHRFPQANNLKIVTRKGVEYRPQAVLEKAS
ncbi:MAG: isochorismatase family protein [Candidatus Melainabacteria bacterium]|nr:isochorismatase family protein [Candidatus Melainabacteria bacterium]